MDRDILKSETSEMQYGDVNDLYGLSMTQPLPFADIDCDVYIFGAYTWNR